MQQAYGLARSYPDDMPAIVVKVGTRDDVFPYAIYIREEFGDKTATKRLRKAFRKTLKK